MFYLLWHPVDATRTDSVIICFYNKYRLHSLQRWFYSKKKTSTHRRPTVSSKCTHQENLLEQKFAKFATFLGKKMIKHVFLGIALVLIIERSIGDRIKFQSLPVGRKKNVNKI